MSWLYSFEFYIAGVAASPKRRHYASSSKQQKLYSLAHIKTIKKT